jgi:site-specific DNA recombinase
MRPDRVLAYVRVSSDAQERTGTSLAGQRDEITRYCAALGWPEARFWVEAESAGEEKLARRVQLRALIDEARRGDVIIVAKQDRWSRDTLFFLQSARDLQARGVRFLSLAERFDLDTPEGKFAATVMAGVAEQERARIKARTVGRRREMRDQGCWTEGVAPFGYRRDPSTRRLVVQPVEAARVRELYARCIAGESTPALAEWLRDERVGRVDGPAIRWDKKAIHSILRARWYLGEVRHTDDIWYPAHEPLVDRVTYDRAQEALATRRKGGRTPKAESRTAGFLLRGMAVCPACGRRIGYAYGPRDWTASYYACNGRLRGGDCDQPYARVAEVDAVAGALTLARLEELRHLLARGEAATTSPDEDRVAALRSSLDAAKVRRGRAVSLAVDGIITRDELRTRLAAIDDEVGRLERRIADEGHRARAVDPKVRAATLADVERLRLAWDRLGVEPRRAILVRLAERIEVQNGEPRMVWRGVDSLAASVDGNLFVPTDTGRYAERPKPRRKVGKR